MSIRRRQVEWYVESAPQRALSDDQCRQIRHRVLKDWRIAARQAMSLCRGIIRALGKLMVTIPIVAVGALMLLTLFETSLMGDFLAEVAKDPQAGAQALADFFKWVTWSVVLAGMVVCAWWPLGILGIRDEYERAFDAAVALELGIEPGCDCCEPARVRARLVGNEPPKTT